MKHQNAALTIKALRSYIPEVPANPEIVSKDTTTGDKLEAELPDEVIVSQWTRVETEERWKKKKKHNKNN